MVRVRAKIENTPFLVRLWLEKGQQEEKNIQVGLKSLFRHGLSETEFYSDFVYELKKIVGSYIFSAQFIKIISHYKKIGYNINVCFNRLHAWWSTQSRLATLLSSLIVRRWVVLQTI